MYYNFIIYLHNQFFFYQRICWINAFTVSPKLLFPSHFDDTKKINKHTCQLFIFEFYEREEIQDFFIDMAASAFIWKNS